MAFAPFTCALGDSPEVEITAGAEVDIAPADDSVNSNRVRIVGTGTITSFGVACDGVQGELGEPATVTKRVAFVPTAPGITLHHNPPGLSLLGGVDRVITKNAFGTYTSDIYGWWTEISFAQADLTPDQHKRGGLVSIITYTASATITIPPNATRAWVRMWGGTGASGPATGDGSGGLYCSPGVGSAGYLEKFLTGLTPGNTLVHTHGAAGSPPASWTLPGGNGGDSILASGTQSIGTLTARGSDGSSTTGALAVGTPGGIASGGDINLTGQNGGLGGANIPGAGGALNYSLGANGTTSTTAGNAGTPGGLIIAWFNDPLS